jgi:AAA domain
VQRAVAREQRFHSIDNPCPVCGGGQDLHGDERCFGFLLSNGKAAICTAVESATPAPDADGWVHEIGEEIEFSAPDLNGHAEVDDSNPLTLKEFAASKRLPVAVLRELGCRDVAGGVRVGKKIRQREPKYKWARGRSSKSDPLFPMPGREIESSALFTAGETDMLTARAAGLVAFAITSGEKRSQSSLTTGHWRDLMRRGLRHAIIVGDGDDHGLDALREMARAAQAAGLEVSVVDLSPLYDHFGAGIKDLNELWQSLDCNKKRFLAAVDEHTREYAQSQVYTLDSLRTLAQTKVTFLVDGFVSPGEKMGLTGPPKTGKTWIALNLAWAVATGSDFLSRPEWHVREARPVVFVEEEGDLVKFSQRIARAFRDVEHAEFHLIPKSGFSLLDRAQVDWLIERVQERDAGLLVLDPWQRMIVGADEDKAKETGPAWDEVHRITLECPTCAVVIIHHANKAGGLTLNAIRGSSRFAGEVDLSMIVKVDSPGVIHAALEGRDLPRHLSEDGFVEIVHPLDDPFALNATGFTIKAPSPGRPDKESAVLSFFTAHRGDWFTKTQVAEGAEISNSTAGAHIDALASRGVLERDGRKFCLNEGAAT